MDFDFKQKWTKKAYKEFMTYLEFLGEDSYKEFNYKLIPGENRALGIRVPTQRKVAKEISKGDADGFLKVCGSEYIEELMIQSFVIASVKDVDKAIEKTEEFIPLIRNWAVCDSFCSTFKNVERYPEKFLGLIDKAIEGGTEFGIRFGVVMLMDHFIKDEYIDRVLAVYESIKSDKYYVNMAVAWGISVCFVKFPEKTLPILTEKRLDDFTHNKSIQKICESYRVDKEDKERLKKLKV